MWKEYLNLWKEYLNYNTYKRIEINKAIDTTRKSIWKLNWDVIKNYFKKALNRVKNFFVWDTKTDKKENTTWNKTQKKHNETKEKSWWNITPIEITQNWWNTISNEMFQQLLSMEWKQNFTAKIHGKTFWETFVTWPYGMVYKHIDENWNLLKNPITFKDGEHVSPSWAEKNAKAYYDKKARQRKKDLDQKWCQYNQDMLDALVSASWWTPGSYKYLKNFVLTHREDKNAIYNFRLKFATTAAWNGKVMPWLVRRRKFEANWFKWIKKPFSSYPVK